ncbi:Scr1 family TA system antitoxin-like transcriptional regulator [Streptomyces sp. NPDC057654]|uniref:Scr1 family TA system antitoxin-like transcriptional regulator n=1 Tax=Streptomyces sp. NPDC057654 TaxID=3346196 RepID=UPI003688DC50
MAELEHCAVAIRTGQTAHMPGLLQHEGYVCAVLGGAVPKPAPKTLERRLAFRLRRSEVLDRADHLGAHGWGNFTPTAAAPGMSDTPGSPFNRVRLRPTSASHKALLPGGNRTLPTGSQSRSAAEPPTVPTTATPVTACAVDPQGPRRTRTRATGRPLHRGSSQRRSAAEPA